SVARPAGSPQIEGPTRKNPENLTTELDPDCEVLDRARIQPGARLGERTIVDSGAEVGTQVVTGTDTEIGSRAAVGDFSRLNSSIISDDARIGHGFETGHSAYVEIGRASCRERVGLEGGDGAREEQGG